MEESEKGQGRTLTVAKPDDAPPTKKMRLFSRIDLDKMVKESGSPSERDFLPDEDLLRQLVGSYFRYIHPWIPVLQVRDFEKRMVDPDQRPAVVNILHAMVTATVKFSTDDRLALRKTRDDLAKLCRERVILTSMESFSVENLQALIIIAFDLIGDGKGPNTWAIVDSMTRVVEHLQLSFEWEDIDMGTGRNKMFRRVRFLRPPSSWIEDEERRRVFWNVFFLDRFCSIATGWNPSLTAHDVKRRLPSEGSYFQQDMRARTRYFNIDGRDEPPLPADSEEITSLGGLAYCVESTELLSQVARFYSEHDVHPQSLEALQETVRRYKELDMKLVRWKNNLPPEWTEVKPKLNFLGDWTHIDENMMLAHVTHNTSVILLHQYIAYERASWLTHTVTLASREHSANTCVQAAKEICRMTLRFLKYNNSVTNPQFAFCIFIAGRVLIAHANAKDVDVDPDFHTIVKSLNDLGRLWAGPQATGTSEHNLARKFAQALSDAYSRRRGRAVDITASAYTAMDGDTAGDGTRTPVVPGISRAESVGFLEDFQDMFDYAALSETAGGSVASNAGEVLDIDSNFVEELQFLFDDPAFRNLDRVWMSDWKDNTGASADDMSDKAS